MMRFDIGKIVGVPSLEAFITGEKTEEAANATSSSEHQAASDLAIQPPKPIHNQSPEPPEASPTNESPKNIGTHIQDQTPHS
jgi:hypothetical protein